MIPRIPRIAVPILVAAALCLPHMAEAKHRGGGKPTPTPVRHHTVIEAISNDSITVTTTNGGSTETYKINAGTEVTYNGEDVSASQLQVGMSVQVTADMADSDTAEIVAANAAPVDPTPASKGNRNNNNNGN
jgi:hypothetical protein